MNIGILTHHWVFNYGANLQTLSTVSFLKKHGHNPFVINWVQEDAEGYYYETTTPEMVEMFRGFQKNHYPLTDICRNSRDIADVIKKYNIEYVVIGSDTVWMLRKFMAMSESVFPNPFWGEFLDYGANVPVTAYSAATLDIVLRDFEDEKKKIGIYLNRFRFISTRDKYTSEMVAYFTDNSIVPAITPDPVFSFNSNYPQAITREEFLNKYNLPEKYLLVCFAEGYANKSREFVDALNIKARSAGYDLFELPRQTGNRIFDIQQINEHINPIEWYNLIRFSNGYVGQLMHPIVISIHNAVPFYSLDQYGTQRYRRIYVKKETSKTYQLIKQIGRLKQYRNISGLFSKLPSASHVLNTIINSSKESDIAIANTINSFSDESMKSIIK